MTEFITRKTPPTLHSQSEKERKYDRQLRLWAASGQSALESANVLLVNSGAGTVGVESLKNLVLPGIGEFTIFDGVNVTEADLGVNFFLDDSCLGKPRSQCCVEYLLELNPEVQGHSFVLGEGDKSLERLLATSPIFTIIMYTFPIQSSHQDVLHKYGRQHKTPLVAIHSAGLYSYFRISLPGAFSIVETHPDETARTDLRFLRPWPELLEFARNMTKDIDNLDHEERGHLPYVVILLHYLDGWKDTHDGAYPTTYAEKIEFRRIIQNAMRTDNPEGGEENFEEAIAAVLKTVVAPLLPSGLRDVFEYRKSLKAEHTSGFYIIADAIKCFYEKHKCLPLPGNIPDMKARSKVYVALQNIYKAKARQDVAEVLQMVRATPGGLDVDPAEVELFCKNAAFVKLINVWGDGGSSDRLLKLVSEELANDENAENTMLPLSLLPIYLALQATSHTASATENQIMTRISAVVPEAALSERVRMSAQEVARAGGGELHNISALTGGMVAQEVIKVITKQYIPIDNTCIFDGISSRCQVIRL